MTPTTDDFYVTGQSEFDGTVFFDGSVNFLGIGMRFYDDGELQFGSLGDNRIDHSTAQTVPCMIMALDQVARNLIICEHDDRNTDFGLVASTNPTLCIQSADAASPTQRGCLTHDQTYFEITEGSGNGVRIPLLVGGAIELPQDGELVEFVSLPVSDTPAVGTEVGYCLMVDKLEVATIKADADSSGSISNRH